MILVMTLAALYQEAIRVGCTFDRSGQIVEASSRQEGELKLRYCPAGDWTRCPMRFGIDRKDEAVKRLAILVSGQLSRLEISSKLEYLVKSNVEKFELYAVFLLSIGEPKASNYHNRVDGPIKFDDWQDFDRVAADISKYFGRVSKVHRSRVFRDKVVSRQVFYFSVVDTEDRPIVHVAFGLTRDESSRKVLLNPSLSAPTREVSKQENQQDMFRNMRSTMMLLEDIEVRMRLMMDFVLRIREDSFVLRPLLLEYDPTWSDFLFMTPKCWTSGGFSDSIFLMGRAIASKILRGLVEEYYLSLDEHYINPERYVKKLVKRNRGQIIQRHVCEWPVLPVLFQLKGSRLYLHLRYQSYMDAMNACGAASYNGSCVFREAASLSVRKDIQYEEKRFTTWT